MNVTIAEVRDIIAAHNAEVLVGQKPNTERVLKFANNHGVPCFVDKNGYIAEVE